MARGFVLQNSRGDGAPWYAGVRSWAELAQLRWVRLEIWHTWGEAGGRWEVKREDVKREEVALFFGADRVGEAWRGRSGFVLRRRD